MKAERLFQAMENISDRYIEEAVPDGQTANRIISSKHRFNRLIPFAACFVFLLLVTTAFAVNYVQDNISEFYLRYLLPEDMAVADSMAEQYGPKVYFDALQSGDVYKQYFAINKLVEYYNDEDVQEKAIDAITPFLTNSEKKLSDAAAFALSALTSKFDDPRFIHLADGSVVFTLFNNYSDYGSQNIIRQVKDGEMTTYWALSPPHMYIRWMIPSPDAKLFAVVTVSNKSTYLWINDTMEGYVSKELIDTARIMVAKDMGYTLQQSIDFENYSEIAEKSINGEDGVSYIVDNKENIRWIDNDTIEFEASLRGDVQKVGEVEDFYVSVIVRYNFRTKHMEYDQLS